MQKYWPEWFLLALRLRWMFDRTVTLKTAAQTLITNCSAWTNSWTCGGWLWSYVTLSYNIFCLQRLAEEFAQPSITPPPPHIQYVIMNVPRLYVRLRRATSSGRRGAGDRQEQRLHGPGHNICLCASEHNRCRFHRRENKQLAGQTPESVPRSYSTLCTDQPLPGHNKEDRCVA